MKTDPFYAVFFTEIWRKTNFGPKVRKTFLGQGVLSWVARVTWNTNIILHRLGLQDTVAWGHKWRASNLVGYKTLTLTIYYAKREPMVGRNNIYGAQGDIFYMTIPTHTVTPSARLSQEVNDARPSLNNLRENLLTKWPMTIDNSQIKRRLTTFAQLSANAHWSQTHRQWPKPRSNGCAWERWRTDGHYQVHYLPPSLSYAVDNTGFILAISRKGWNGFFWTVFGKFWADFRHLGGQKHLRKAEIRQ